MLSYAGDPVTANHPGAGRIYDNMCKEMHLPCIANYMYHCFALMLLLYPHLHASGLEKRMLN